VKPQLLKVSVNPSSSFSIREDAVPYFYNRLHYHPEVELVYILKGSGTQFIGDNISRFKSGDMVLVGKGLPHYWRCDETYFEDNKNLTAKALVLHFKEDFWGDDFLKLPENRSIEQLLRKAQKGIRINTGIKRKIYELLTAMQVQNGSSKIALLLQVLELIAGSAKLQTICSEGFYPVLQEKEYDRINDIYAYILAHFSETITVDKISKVAHISPNSFCRYFKTKTKKTFSHFLHEIRIGHACKLLMETAKPLQQVCYDCGFNNFVNFHKYFKIITGKTPNEYRKFYAE
jgi:AraC-like DNA-binding protein